MRAEREALQRLAWRWFLWYSGWMWIVMLAAPDLFDEWANVAMVGLAAWGCVRIAEIWREGDEAR